MEYPSYDYPSLYLGFENDTMRLVLYGENLFDAENYTNAYQKVFAGGLFIEPFFHRAGIRGTYQFYN